MIYVDTSAFLKLVFEEAETKALRSYLERDPAGLASSALLAVEARRAAHRSPAARALQQVDLALSGVTLVHLGDGVIEDAGRLPGSHLRSLDAIHLATLLLIRADVDRLLCYDHRLAEAASSQGIETVAPA